MGCRNLERSPFSLHGAPSGCAIAKLPIVGCPAQDGDGRDSYLVAGRDACLGNPKQVKELEQFLQRWLPTLTSKRGSGDGV